MEQVAEILIRYAKSRRRAFRTAGISNGSIEKAAERIINVAQYFSSKPASKQLIGIHQVKPEILFLLPSENSPFQKLRIKILSIIHQSEMHYDLLAKSKPT